MGNRIIWTLITFIVGARSTLAGDPLAPDSCELAKTIQANAVRATDPNGNGYLFMTGVGLYATASGFMSIRKIRTEAAKARGELAVGAGLASVSELRGRHSRGEQLSFDELARLGGAASLPNPSVNSRRAPTPRPRRGVSLEARYVRGEKLTFDELVALHDSRCAGLFSKWKDRMNDVWETATAPSEVPTRADVQDYLSGEGKSEYARRMNARNATDEKKMAYLKLFAGPALAGWGAYSIWKWNSDHPEHAVAMALQHEKEFCAAVENAASPDIEEKIRAQTNAWIRANTR